MDVNTVIDPVQQHSQLSHLGRRPLPSIDSVSKSNKADNINDEAKEEFFCGSVAGTIRGPREMATGQKRLTSSRRESGQGASISNISESTAMSPNIIVEKKIAVQEQDPTTPLSFSQRAAQLDRTPTPLLVQGDPRLLQDIDRAPPGDPPILRPRRKSFLSLTGSKRGANLNTNKGANVNNVDSSSANKRSSRLLSESIVATASGEYTELARKRSQYFEDIFSARDSGDNSPAKERIRSESLVLADIRTNVHVGDEFTIITELSAHLASRYSRPLSSIVVTIQHGQCMCFGGSFDSAYVMYVTALPSQLQPTTNKRNAALIQKHMEEALGVPPARGHLRFVPVPETNLAYAGNTTIGHLDELSRSASINGGGGGAATKEMAYDSHSSPLHNGGMYTSSSAKINNVPGQESTTAQSQAVSSGLGSRKHKTTRKLSVKGISSTFKSPTPSPDKANKPNKTSKTTKATPPPESTHVTQASQLATPAVPTASTTTTPTASALPVIPERSLKEGKHGKDREREKETDYAPNAKDQSQTQTQIRGETDKSGGRISIHELLARGSTPAPQPACSEQTTNPPNPGRKPSQRARRTKSFVATFFGRSVSASAATAPKIDEEG